MTSTSIKWTRTEPGLYVSECGTYEIARTLGAGSAEISSPWWVPYRKAADGWRRLAGRNGVRTLTAAKAVCQDHADTEEQA